MLLAEASTVRAIRLSFPPPRRRPTKLHLMLTLRCTARLLKHLRLKPEPSPAASTTALGDWYANVLTVGRERLVLCVSSVTLLPVVLPLAGGDLHLRLAGAVRESLVALGVPAPRVDAELEAMVDVTWAKTASRSVLGSMNDFDAAVPFYREPGQSLLDLGLRLGEMPCSPIDYEHPVDAAVRALGGTPLASRAQRFWLDQRGEPPSRPPLVLVKRSKA